ncbi:tyrosine protein kinase SWE1 [Aspergillus clavatus NRRL 1]|uniref:Protein kinase, putative n=1 Tax=Aspergillus clavatus (strain ATCC 1007 / CBS 513.65 / DSM 816 / NCTC 3887 / NRRL 1 / QM 1276 / 107) TaxID=344612 RepID=A1CSJ9_ASPCL|nr:protein kinase, putative [Aspergillus clavatus NRRL 1]EAW06286.1 protein kinase, putative [Aspergillus clavatus NRRL 1]
MVATFSPHRDAGGTLHLPSHTGIHHVDASSAIRQLRRSLSRSPSKSSNFSLLASRSHSPSKSTPFISSALSPSRRSSQSSFVLFPSSSHPSPFALPYPQSAKITRPVMRRTRTSPRSPVKRALNVSTDQGNAKPIPPAPVMMTTSPSGAENTPGDLESLSDDAIAETMCLNDGSTSADSTPAPRPSLSRIEKRRSGTFGSFATVSPLKRSDGIMHLDRASRGSPSAKRRSVHAATYAGDFSIFDNEGPSANPVEDFSAETPMAHEASSFFPSTTPPFSSPFNTIPKRSSSLRRSTLQQRQVDRSLFSRPRNMGDETLDPASPVPARPRMSLDGGLFQPNRDSLFSPRPAPVSPLFSTNHPGAGPTRPAAHPLSRTITQSSSGSSLADDSPTHEPMHKLERPKGVFNFSKSLPAGATRPAPVRHLSREDSTSSVDSFATPENYKLVKPLPAAFMSTGLISKRNRNAEDHQSSLGYSKNMPDTPCKRPINLFPTGQKPLGEWERPRMVPHADAAAPPSPSHLSSTRPKPGPFGRGMGIFGSSFNKPDLSRRGSFVSVDGDELITQSQSPSAQMDSQPMGENDFPPTPTKQTFFPSRTYPPATSQIASLERLSETLGGTNSSPLHDKFQRGSPHTPRDSHLFPPDPSGLSISAANDQHSIQPDFHSATLPATPTGPRDSFVLAGKRPSLPLNGYNAPDVDPSLTSRFEQIELVGTGEFSQVYRVAQPDTTSASSIFSLPSGTTSPKTLPDRVWAVKKSKQPYVGLKDRERRIREVDALKALANSDHVISLVDSWEDHGYLYIQTEFCEEGSLDVFLAQVGLKARLDDFRIWKILLELSVGLKHIHDSGFIHLDLKPANILITFEGVLKIADFGMAARWPAEDGIDGEGDREYIGPEILMGRYDKPADIFSLGLIMFEIAGNVELPDNGLSWQKLRNGDMSDVPSLTWSSETSIFRDPSGNPISEEPSFEELCASDFGDDDFGEDSFPTSRPRQAVPLARSDELIEPPSFMIDANHEQALDKIVRWMISPDPSDRPMADQLLETHGVQFVDRRRRAGATVYEGNWGPADEMLAEDAEMIDV